MIMIDHDIDDEWSYGSLTINNFGLHGINEAMVHQHNESVMDRIDFSGTEHGW